MDICSLDGAKRLQNYVANTVIGIIEEEATPTYFKL